MAAKADLENWPDVMKKLDDNPPIGWYLGKRWYGERPNSWRALAPMLTGQTFEAQREPQSTRSR
jgi:hypothetical protein